MYNFKIKPTNDGRYRVNFSYNSEIMVWSESFTTKASAQDNIQSIKGNSPNATIVDRTLGEVGFGYRWEIAKAVSGEYFTRFVASNGETMVHSETYTQKHNAKNCAESVSRNAPFAIVLDETAPYVA